MTLIWLALAWGIWCGLHSLLIHPPVEQRLSAAIGRWQESYRLLYNLFALLTLAPVGALYFVADPSPVLLWPSWLKPLQWLCWGAAAALTYAAARVYDMPSFLGIRYLSRAGDARGGTEASGGAGLAMTGILSHSRHPWYLAGFLLLWSRDLAARDLVTNCLLTAYLLIGIWLEERKLLRQFGDAYQAYRQQVPMLWRWRRARSERRDV